MNDLGLKGCFQRYNECSLKWKIRSLFTDLKYAWQRAYRGYDSRELWGFDGMFRIRTIEILKKYKETRGCLWWCPDSYEIGNYDSIVKKYVLTSEQMDMILDTLIFHLQMSDSDFVEKQLYGNCVDDDDWEIECMDNRDYMIIERIRKQNQNAALDLIKMFFDQLWD